MRKSHYNSVSYRGEMKILDVINHYDNYRKGCG